MSPADTALGAGDLAGLALLVLAVAALYSSVGHAGASGYLAAMALFGLPAAVMKPTALALNILVATIGTVQFARAGCFSWRAFWPFALTSVPFAFLGGALALPGVAYRRLLGAVLLFGAWRLLQRPRAAAAGPQAVPVGLALPLGAGIGLLAGLTGVGGGIFLSPLLLLAGWADARTTAGVSVAFILANSAAGLLGHVSSVRLVPPEAGVLAAAAVAGGAAGSTLGSRRLPQDAIRRLLAVVLVIAGLKLLLVR